MKTKKYKKRAITGFLIALFGITYAQEFMPFMLAMLVSFVGLLIMTRNFILLDREYIKKYRERAREKNKRLVP